MPNDPEKEGYIFDGWYWDNNVWSKPFTANSLLDAPFSSNMSVYAKWTAIEYTATFKADGNTVGTATYTIEDNAIKNVPSVPTKDGYDGAWESYTIKTGGMTVNAVYTAKQYTITYSGTKGVTNSNKTSYTPDTETFSLSDLSKEGYTFDGWYNGTTKVTKIEKGSYGNLNLEAKWTAIEYTISYELNGGINDPSNPTTYTVEDLSFSLKNPSKENYDFKGWKFNNSSISYINTQNAQNYVLTATWSPHTYSISYIYNGGTGTNPSSYNVESSDIVLTNPTKNGYTFIGWTGSNGDVPESNITIEHGSSGDRTYTANWSLDSYSITYVLYGGINATKNPSSYSIEDDINLKPATKDYYDFGGWYKEPEFINKVETLHGQFGNLVLYAKFTPYTYQSSFDANGGQIKFDIVVNYCNENGDVKKVSITNGQNINLYSDIEIPSRNGYIFAGWYLDSNYENEVPSEFCLTQDTNIYAKWQVFNSSSTYSALTDTGISAIGLGQSGSNFTTTIYFYVPFTYTGECSLTYSFTGTKNYGGKKQSASSKGYITDVTTGKSIFSNTLYENYSGTTTLQLTPGHYYKIYATAGYIASGSYAGSSWHLYQAKCTLKLVPNESKVSTFVCKNEFSQSFETNSIILSSAHRDGYDFLGWYDENNELIYDIWNYTCDKEFHAKWTIHTYSVSYNLNGGVNNSSNPNSFVYTDYVELINPEREGYSFEGWYSDSNFSNKITHIDGSKYTDVELFAKWIPNTYVANLDYVGGQNCPTINFYSDGNIIKTIDLYNDSAFSYYVPVKEGYVFAGWYTNYSFTNLFSFNETVNKNLNLYAKWVSKGETFISLGTETSVSINGNTMKYLEIVASSNQTITIYSVSDMDLYGCVCDNNYNVLSDSDDISNDNLNFSVTITIEAGKKYYIGYKANQVSVSGFATIIIGGTQIQNTSIVGAYTPTIDSVNVTYDSSFTLPTPKKEGYEFEGWYDADGNKINESCWNYAENITIYAHWKEKL